MIKNERQYGITKSQIAKFEEALAADPESSKETATLHPLLRKAQREAIQSQLSDLQDQVQSYDALRSGRPSVLSLESFDQLPTALIQARIASGMSQKQLAENIGLKEQQIQRYEATDYASASMRRLKEVVKALGVSVRHDFFLPRADTSPDALFGKLEAIGFSRKFVLDRLLPRALAAQFRMSDGVVFAFSGQRRSGKTTTSRAIADAMDWPCVSFGGHVRDMARRRGLDVSDRIVLQEVGASLVEANCADFCSSVLAQANWKRGQSIVIDGVRHREVLDELRSLVTPSRLILIYLTLDESLRETRLRQEDDPDVRGLKDIESHSTESQVTTIIHTLADFVLDASRSTEDLRDQVLSQYNLTPATNKGSTITLNAASIIARIFKSTAADLLGNAPLQLDAVVRTMGARYKAPKNTNDAAITAYTLYAHHMALLALEATSKYSPKEFTMDAATIRHEILQRYGSLAIEHVLRYIWNLGVVVLPLNDPGSFHGACFRIKGRNVIVLKQKNHSEARWLNDVLHELGHAAQEPNQKERSVIESDELSQDRRDSSEEKMVSEFAGAVLLGPHADELVEMCVDEAKGKVEFLKAVVPQIALRENVSVGLLANYMAYRLWQDDVTNWWGAAANLQDRSTDAWRVSRDLFLEYSRLDPINAIDRELLKQALTS